jgi:hypothetical protein
MTIFAYVLFPYQEENKIKKIYYINFGERGVM